MAQDPITAGIIEDGQPVLVKDTESDPRFGHPAGDQLLKEISRVIPRNLRELDVLCRYSGDEFTVI